MNLQLDQLNFIIELDMFAVALRVLGRGLGGPVCATTKSASLRCGPVFQSVAKLSTIVLTKDLERAQKSQEVSLRENCILVDPNDKPTGHASKRDCHRVGDNGKLLLHRAFSVFLFNTRGEMLVQRRSSHKVSSWCWQDLGNYPWNQSVDPIIPTGSRQLN